MNKDWGSLEVLLVLCCIVGAVAFVCCAVGLLSLTMTTTAESMANPGAIEAEKTLLVKQKSEKEKALSDLENQLRDFENMVADKQKRLESLKRDGATSRTGVEEAYLMTEEINRLDRALKRTEEDLARRKKSAMIPQDRRAAEEEIKRLQNELDEIKANLEKRRKEFTLMTIPVDNSLSMEEQKLRREIREAERQIEELRNQYARKKGDANTFNPYMDLAGAQNLTNPLFVECKSETISVYPEGKSYSSEDLKKKNPFTALKLQHDGVYFLIRPDGYDMFEEGMELAEKAGFKNRGYEPVEAHRKIDLAR